MPNPMSIPGRPWLSLDLVGLVACLVPPSSIPFRFAASASVPPKTIGLLLLLLLDVDYDGGGGGGGDEGFKGANTRDKSCGNLNRSNHCL